MIKGTKQKGIIYRVSLLLLILLWSYSSMSKLTDISRFQQALTIFNFPFGLKLFFSFGIPISELLIAIFLITPRYRKPALWFSMLLLSGFTIYVILAVFNFFEKRPCACGGVLSMLSWRMHLFFNITFSLINALAIFLSRRHPSVSDLHDTH